MSKVTVDQNKCIACGACEAAFPELFKLDGEDNKSKVINSDYKKFNYKKEEIESICPAEAINVESD